MPEKSIFELEINFGQCFKFEYSKLFKSSKFDTNLNALSLAQAALCHNCIQIIIKHSMLIYI